MLFSSISYLLFLPPVLLLFWLLPHRFRGALLLVASYYFYMSWIPVYGLLLFVLTLVNYFLGMAIYSARTKCEAQLSEGQPTKASEVSRRAARAWLWLGVVINLSTLSYFKYTDFAIASWNKAVAISAPWLHLNVQTMSFPLQHVLLPLGISFFVFEFIHYIVDVYKGSKTIGNFIHFSLFAAFFPSQIAGPIKRYQDFIKQLETARVFSSRNLELGLCLILQGLFKKVALADNLSPIVAQGFAHSASLGFAESWIASLAFALQIYCDFSGYTDMGRGSALMMGYDLPDNFNYPYIARSLSDFWKRWHISLSSWLRDYLYIPLGGSKWSMPRRYTNLFLTMLLGGLWHGASWHFVVWGAFHGLGLIVCHTYEHLLNVSAGPISSALKGFHASLPGKAFSMLATFFFVLVAWVFFRAENLSQAFNVLSAMFAPHAVSTWLALDLERYPIMAAVVAYSVYRLVWDRREEIALKLPLLVKEAMAPLWPARVVIYLAVFVMATGLAPSQASPFIYFAF